MLKEEKIKLMETISYWWHYIDLGDGIVTPGQQGGKNQKRPTATDKKLELLQLPTNLQGKTVLDIGCSDGVFSFECKKRGAKRVVAIDDPRVNVRTKAFFVARQILNMDVEFIFSDIYDLNIKDLGQFDIVLGLGLLYHLKSPLIALDIIKKLTKEFALIETCFVNRPESIMEYKANFDKDGNRGSHGHSMWHPSLIALKEMMRDVGFKTIDVLSIYNNRVVFKII